MIAPLAVEISNLSHAYGARTALSDLSLSIASGEIVAVLGPNGGGKTTLFRLLSTLIPIKSGRVCLLGHDLAREAALARRLMGVVFQAPSLDKKLTVVENIRLQGSLYGLSGSRLRAREQEMLAALALTERAGERTEALSGGLRRRVELAKGLIHEPRLLLLDEPSTGLDPAARSDLWTYLRRVRSERGVTIVLTTHLLEEADKADRIAILNEGRLVAWDAPDALRATVGGDAITIQSAQPARLCAAIRERFGCGASVLDETVRLEQADGYQWISRLVEAFPDEIQSITLGKPTLEDVFIDRTGHRFMQDKPVDEPPKKSRHK